MKPLAVLTALLLAGCATRSWTETTDVTRAAGPTREAVVDKPLAEHMLLARTGQETDGFRVDRRLFTDDNGVARLPLLAAALQCLAYGHEVRLVILQPEGERELHAERINAQRARDIIEQWRVQARLGSSVPLRASEARLLDRVAAAETPEVAAALAEIKPRLDIRPDWE
jgi:hypothetical protein